MSGQRAFAAVLVAAALALTGCAQHRADGDLVNN